MGVENKAPDKDPGRCKLAFFFFFNNFFTFYFILFIYFAYTTAYGGLQARGLIRATAAGLHHRHSNTRSKPHLQPTP